MSHPRKHSRSGSMEVWAYWFFFKVSLVLPEVGPHSPFKVLSKPTHSTVPWTWREKTQLSHDLIFQEVPKLSGRGLLFPWITLQSFPLQKHNFHKQVQFMICPRQTGAQNPSLSHPLPHPTSPITSKYTQGPHLAYIRQDWSVWIVWPDNSRLGMSAAT